MNRPLFHRLVVALGCGILVTVIILAFFTANHRYSQPPVLLNVQTGVYKDSRQGSDEQSRAGAQDTRRQLENVKTRLDAYLSGSGNVAGNDHGVVALLMDDLLTQLYRVRVAQADEVVQLRLIEACHAVSKDSGSSPRQRALLEFIQKSLAEFISKV